jgi:chromosome segregation ATPase
LESQNKKVKLSFTALQADLEKWKLKSLEEKKKTQNYYESLVSRLSANLSDGEARVKEIEEEQSLNQKEMGTLQKHLEERIAQQKIFQGKYGGLQDQFDQLKDSYEKKLMNLEELEHLLGEKDAQIFKLSQEYKHLENENESMQEKVLGFEANNMDMQQQNIGFKKELHRMSDERRHYEEEMRIFIQKLEDDTANLKHKNLQAQNLTRKLQADLNKIEEQFRGQIEKALEEERTKNKRDQRSSLEELDTLRSKLQGTEETQKEMVEKVSQLRLQLSSREEQLSATRRRMMDLKKDFKKKSNEFVKVLKSRGKKGKNQAVSLLIEKSDRLKDLHTQQLKDLSSRLEQSKLQSKQFLLKLESMKAQVNTYQRRIEKLLTDKALLMKQFAQPQVVSLAGLVKKVKTGSEDEKAQAIIILGDIGDSRSALALSQVAQNPENEWLAKLARESIAKMNQDAV